MIAKPLAATVLAVAVKLFADSTSFSGLASGAVGMVLACGAPLMALKLVSFAGGEIAGAAQMAGGGHVFSRAGNFTGRQLGRQFGGKMHLPGVGSKGPTPVASRTPSIPLHQKAATLGGQPWTASPKPAPTSSGATPSQHRPSSKAWPMPPGPAAKGGGGAPGKGPEPPAESGQSDPMPSATGRAPTTSRYGGKAQSGNRNSGSKPSSGPMPNPSAPTPASTVAPPVNHQSPAPTSGPKPQPPSSTPVSSPRPVDQSKRPPSNTYRNGDEGHD